MKGVLLCFILSAALFPVAQVIGGVVNNELKAEQPGTSTTGSKSLQAEAPTKAASKENVGPPTAPRDLQITSVNSSSIRISWKLPEKANGSLAGYVVGYSGFQKTLKNLTNNYTFEKLTPFTEYEVYVLAYNEEKGKIVKSPPAKKKTKTSVEAPTAPRDLQIISVNSSSISISWKLPEKANGPLAGYVVGYGGFKEKLKNLTNKYTFGKLTTLTEYEVYVLAYNEENGKMLESQPAKKKIKTSVEAPSSPRDLKVTSVTKTSISISWKPPENTNVPLKGYIVGFEKTKTDLTSVQTTYTFEKLSPWTEYEVYVLAYNEGWSGKQESAAVKAIANTTVGAPTAPQNLRIIIRTSSSISISWKLPEKANGPLAGYVVGYGEFKETLNYLINTYTFENLTLFTEYEVYVLAYNQEKDKMLESPPAKKKTKTSIEEPSPCRNLRVVNMSLSSAHLVWDSPSHPNGLMKRFAGYFQGREFSIPVRNTPPEGSRRLTYLEAGQTYIFEVRAINMDDMTTVSFASNKTKISFTTPSVVLSRPGNFTADVTSRDVSLTWQEPQEWNGTAKGYILEDFEMMTIELDVKNQTYLRTGLSPWKKYDFFLSGFTENEDGVRIVGERVMLKAETDMEAPSEPPHIAIVAYNAINAQVGWNSPKFNNGPLTGYLVGTEPDKMAHTRENSYWFENLPRETKYNISVMAYNKMENGTILKSSPASIIFQTDIAVPSPCENLTFVSVTYNKLELKWNYPNESIDGYTLIRYGGGDYVKHTVLTTSFKDIDVTPSTTYIYSVRAFRKSLQSRYNLSSAETDLKMTTTSVAPSKPKDPQVTAISKDSITISWKPPETPIKLAGYVVGYGEFTETLYNNHNNYTFENLSAWSNYELFLVPYNMYQGTKYKGPETKLSAMTSVDCPSECQNLHNTSTTRNSISLEWIRPNRTNGPIDGYQIRYGKDGTTSSNQTTNSTVVSITNLDAGTKYIFELMAFNEDLTTGEHLYGDPTKIEIFTTSTGSLLSSACEVILSVIMLTFFCKNSSL